jgi:1-acyl-sn-glycerol-3-phosphate acyltransferase
LSVRETLRPSAFWIMAGIAVPIMEMLAKFTVSGKEKLPASGACVVAPNHYSEIDPVMMGAVIWNLGRIPRFLTKASLFKVPVVGWFLRRSGQIPVERGGIGRGNGPVGAATLVAERGNLVIVYPEGTLTRDPGLWPMRGKTGAARLAIEKNIPVIPMAHWGVQQVLPRYSKKVSFFPRKRVQVAFGDPVDLSAYAGRGSDPAALVEATDLIMDAITGLLEGLRSEKAPAQRWNPAEHDQRETGRFEG